MSTSMSTSRNRSGAVDLLSVRGRRDGPPRPPLLKGGKLGETCAFVMAAAGTDPPWPPLLKGGKTWRDMRFCDGGRRDGPPLAPPS